MREFGNCNDTPSVSNACEALPLVLLPGTLCDWRVFAPLLDRLTLGARAVLHIDFEDARTVDAAVSAILAAMPPRAILIGFSLGGIVALALARAAPSRVAAVGVVGSTARPVEPATHAARRSQVTRTCAVGITGYAQAVAANYLSAPMEESNVATIVAMAQSAGVERFASQTDLALSRSDAREWLSELTMPVLVAGGMCDGVNPPDVQAEIAAALPDATLVLLERAGHFTPLEDPDILAAHVAAWLARADELELSQTKET